MRAARRSRATTRGVVGLALLAAIVELVSRFEVVSPASLPPASSMLVAAGRLVVDPQFLGHLGGTVAAWFAGLGAAALVAIPAGLALGSSGRAYRAAVAAIEVLRPIPSVALIPAVVLVLGRGLDMKVVLIAYASAWPILLNTIYGARDTDPMARETARVFGMGPRQILWRIALPAAAPYVFTGLRVAAPIALVVAVSAELIAGGPNGLGVWMLANSQAGVPRDLLFGGIVVSGLLGLALTAFIAAGERRLAGWHEPHRGRA